MLDAEVQAAHVAAKGAVERLPQTQEIAPVAPAVEPAPGPGPAGPAALSTI